MALITRLSRLFHADMNAVLDQIEEPELLLKQAIREMEETLTHNEKQIKLLEFEQQQLVHKEAELKQSLTELADQLTLCFKSDKDDLAKTLIKRKLEMKQYLKNVSQKIAALKENAEHFNAQLKEQQTQLNSMKQKAEIFNSDNNSNSANTAWGPSFVIQDEDVEVAFLHEKQQWSQS